MKYNKPVVVILSNPIVTVKCLFKLGHFYIDCFDSQRDLTLAAYEADE